MCEEGEGLMTLRFGVDGGEMPDVGRGYAERRQQTRSTCSPKTSEAIAGEHARSNPSIIVLIPKRVGFGRQLDLPILSDIRGT